MDSGNVEVMLFTDRNIYHVAASKEDRSYLGLTFSRRDTGAGNDLTDGAYTKGTWDKIVCDILSCELISLKRRDNPAYVNANL